MQKIYLKYREKYKDKWWLIFPSVFFIWLVNKFFDNTLSKIDFGYSINKAVSFLNYRISILSVLVGVVSAIFIYKIFQAHRVKKRRLKIIHASYGFDNYWLNITNELNKSVINNSLKIVLSNNIAGDPIYGHQKIGNITYGYDGKIYTQKYIEGETIILP